MPSSSSNKEVHTLSPKITVVGVGGAGGNAVNNMITAGLQGCEFVVCNTDAQALSGSMCPTKIQLGMTVTGGLGAGAKPEVGRDAAEETLDEVMRHLEGANMAFITAGMGGGTGTGAAPVIARACREKGILTVGVVTKPFHFEGTTRMRMADSGISEMQQYVDTLIVIPNQNLFRIANEKTTFAEAFKLADSVLQSGVRGVTDLMVMPGLINLDFADIRSAMLEMGKAMMGTGEATGERRAIEAAEAAINNPLLDDVSMKGARGVIINVTGGYDMTLFEVDEACNRIRDEVDPNANIIFGSTFDEMLDGVMRVSVVATGIDVAESARVRVTSGAAIVNAVTGAERKIDRARPMGQDRLVQTLAEASLAPSPVRYTPMNAVFPATMPVRTAAVATRHDDTASDMFTADTVEGDTLVKKSEPVASAAAGSAAPKATIENNSFIPPRPIEAEKPEVSAPTASAPVVGYSAQQSSLSASKAAPMSPDHVSSPHLVLRPPVPGAGATQRSQRRTPSLFERLTQPLRHHDEKDEAGVSAPSAPAPQQQAATPSAAAPSLRAPQRAPSQGNLNIDVSTSSATAAAPAAQAEDELDIPAFLRRQAN
jgi:cell division protein FtsZ